MLWSVLALALTGCAGSDDDRLIPGYYDSHGSSSMGADDGASSMGANDSWESGGSTYGGCEPWDEEDSGEPWDEDAGGESESDSGGDEEACEPLTDDIPPLGVLLDGLDAWAAVGEAETPWCGWLGSAMPGYEACMAAGLVDVELTCSLMASEGGVHSLACNDGDVSAPVDIIAGPEYLDHAIYTGTGGTFQLKVMRVPVVLDGGGFATRTYYEGYSAVSYTLLFAGGELDSEGPEDLPVFEWLKLGTQVAAPGCPDDVQDPGGDLHHERLEFTATVGSKAVKAMDGQRALTDDFELRVVEASRAAPEPGTKERVEFSIFRREP